MTCVNAMNINITRDGAVPIQLSLSTRVEEEEEEKQTMYLVTFKIKCICHSEANRLKGF